MYPMPAPLKTTGFRQHSFNSDWEFSPTAADGTLRRMFRHSSRTWPLAFVLLLVGCTSVSDRQRAVLLEGERAFREREYGRATERLSTFITEVKNGPEVARALYVRGMARALAGQRTWAYSDLQTAARLDGPEVPWQPHAALGVLYFEDENWAAAERAFAQAVARMPDAPPKDAYLFRMGVCAERTGRWQDALETFRRLKSKFTSGLYAGLADRRLQLRASYFAVQCGVFSQRENAEQLAADLNRQGLRTAVRQEQRDGNPVWVVLEGRYDSFAAANQGLAKVRGYVSQAVLWP